ncbi:hypothetical protein [Hydrogenimonas sp. SS33]|uniref:fused DSP-PTPase phosphatase/NAD kinase-like protein n=1 Tax=Hydrogenimonas leucolamina TaxID=2954236 RepID=UPI00336BCC0C
MSKPAVRLDTPARRARAWYRSLIVEHNLVNTLWLNLHPVDEGKLWRSAQPTPWQLKKLVKKYGFKTVINLRGSKPHRPVYALERRTCDELGVTMADISLFSRRIPDDLMLRELKTLFETVEYPALMHCKAGADRSSLASTLYLHWMKKMPVREAMKSQLRFWPYGYIAASGAGVIGAYFEAFVAYEKKHPGADLIAWSKQWRDRDHRKAFEDSFRKEGRSHLADFFFEKILHRE